MTDENSTDDTFTDENGDLGDFEPETTLSENSEPNPSEVETDGGDVMGDDGEDSGVEWVRVRMNAQRGNGPDQRGDATFEAAGSDPETVLKTVKDGFGGAMADLEESLGLGEESEE